MALRGAQPFVARDAKAADAPGPGSPSVRRRPPETALWGRGRSDPGPRFLTDGRDLAMADFACNRYGYPPERWRDWETRAGIDNDLAQVLRTPLVTSRFVSEGGGLEVSTSLLLTHRGTALQRNPGVPLDGIEAEYLRV